MSSAKSKPRPKVELEPEPQTVELKKESSARCTTLSNETLKSIKGYFGVGANVKRFISKEACEQLQVATGWSITAVAYAKGRRSTDQWLVIARDNTDKGVYVQELLVVFFKTGNAYYIDPVNTTLSKACMQINSELLEEDESPP